MLIHRIYIEGQTLLWYETIQTRLQIFWGRRKKSTWDTQDCAHLMKPNCYLFLYILLFQCTTWKVICQSHNMKLSFRQAKYFSCWKAETECVQDREKGNMYRSLWRKAIIRIRGKECENVEWSLRWGWNPVIVLKEKWKPAHHNTKPLSEFSDTKHFCR